MPAATFAASCPVRRLVRSTTQDRPVPMATSRVMTPASTRSAMRRTAARAERSAKAPASRASVMTADPGRWPVASGARAGSPSMDPVSACRSSQAWNAATRPVARPLTAGRSKRSVSCRVAMIWVAAAVGARPKPAAVFARATVKPVSGMRTAATDTPASCTPIRLTVGPPVQRMPTAPAVRFVALSIGLSIRIGLSTRSVTTLVGRSDRFI